jgi:hypothetical protein
MLMRVEGLMEEASSPKGTPSITPIGGANSSKLRELLDRMEEKKTG